MIEVRDLVAPSVEARLTENDKIVFRCMDCQRFILPAEVKLYVPEDEKIRRKKPWLIREACPDCGCFYLMPLSRERFLMTVEAERSGLVLVEEPKLIS